MAYTVAFAPEAQAQLLDIYRYVADAASPEIAARFTDSIVRHCEGLEDFPLRGTRRDDIRPGLRITGFRRRVTIAHTVDESSVIILGVFYGGQDYEAALREDDHQG